MKIFHFLTSACLLCASVLQAQELIPTAPDGMKYTVSYTLEEVKYHKILQGTDMSTLSPLDLNRTEHLRTVKQVERQVTNEGDHSRTVTILNPEEAYSQWYKPFGRIEIDRSGKRVFTTDGALFKDIPADSAYTARYESLKTDLADGSPQIRTAFPMPDAEALTDAENNGWTVRQLENGVVLVERGESSTQYDPERMTVTEIGLSPSGFRTVTTTTYTTTEQGIVTPEVELIEENVIRPSGACMISVTQRTYTGYTMTLNNGDRTRVQMQKASLMGLWPNPAGDQVQLSLDSSVKTDSWVEIYDAFGASTGIRFQVAPDTRISVDLSSLTAGIYFIKIDTDKGLKVLKLARN